MLEVVTLGQARFNCPGVAADERGVAMGRRILCLFADLQRALGFIRALSRAGALKDVLGTLELEEVTAPSGLREVAASFDVAGSYQADGAAAAARAQAGVVYTGTVRHFLPYRDSSRPLGMDVQDASLLSTQEKGYALYQDAGLDRRVPGQRLDVRDLLLRMTPVPLRPKELRDQRPEALFVRVPRGVLPRVQSYLWRRRVDADLSVVRPAQGSLFAGAASEIGILRCRDLPAGALTLLEGTPGVEVYVPALENVLVQRGWRHPVALDGCAALFPRDEVVLFAAGRKTVERVAGPLQPVALDDVMDVSLRQASGAPIPVASLLAAQDVAHLGVEVRLVSDPDARGNAEAAIIPASRLPELLAMVHVLPMALWQGSEVALASPWTVVLAPAGVRAMPLGHALAAIHPRVFLPLGMRFSPRLDGELLSEHFSLGSNDHLVFFPPPEVAPPFAISRGAFVSLSRAAVHPEDITAALDTVNLLPGLNTAGEPVVYHPSGGALKRWDGQKALPPPSGERQG
jgi:hypothetical protein